MPGFVAVGQPLPQDEIEAQLRALTYQEYELATITRGTYIMNEDELPEQFRELLHGRAYVIDKEEISETDSAGARTYYIAADKVQGLIVPSRTLFIKSENVNAHYRFTDDGDKWTDWITLEDGMAHTYIPQELCRFAEVQVYADQTNAIITLRATR